MSKLRNIFENVAAGATGAASIAGARGALFVTSRPVPPMDKVTLSPYAPNAKKKSKIKVSNVTEGTDFDTVTTSSLKDILRQKQRDTELRDTTEVLALEDEEGAIVKVYIKRDQCEDFKAALQSAIADAEEEGKELAEVLYDLHRDFDIVSVDWGQNTIPEDEEQPVENSADAEAKGYPEADELGDVNAQNQGTPDGVSADAGTGLDDMGGDVEGTDPSGFGDLSVDQADKQIDQTQLLQQILGVLNAQASAQRAQAEADKAKADVEAAEAAARAATQYATHQEEVMDMENYNKRQQEEKRENQIQAKLLRYRHDIRKDEGKSLEDNLNDPEYLLNTLKKLSIGESVNKYQPATPEEEEVLHMEDWEKAEKEKKSHEQLRSRLNRFRHERRKTAQTSATNENEEVAQEEEKEFDPKTGSLLDYLLRKAQESNVAND